MSLTPRGFAIVALVAATIGFPVAALGPALGNEPAPAHVVLAGPAR